MAATNRLLGILPFATPPKPGLRVGPTRADANFHCTSGRHGQVCAELVRVLGNSAREHEAGHVLCGNVGFLARRDADSLCTPDVAFVSFARLPRGPLGGDYLSVAPDVVFEVYSRDDQSAEMGELIREYLTAGVRTVVVLDPETATGLLCEAGQTVAFLSPDDMLDVGGVLGSLGVTLRELCG